MMQIRNCKRRQRGLSSVGWLGVVAIFIFLGVTFIRVFPMYYGQFKLNSVLEKLQEDISIDARSKRAIWDAMYRGMEIQEIRNIKRQDVSMKREKGKTTVTVQYETTSSFIGNLTIGARFKSSVVLNR